ncbi:uncharacterized protein BDR25DRAFT_237663 [Lindgomyces ingoldianus]|uniref:Uncharacterized protein n=1 Tax=Lindgomyces ingoldianus TaxID=673940 RepID=A0ACB6QHI1_9PLEO|nr:uncharacterized protein BDR25DRAFT_237663 [Lindgomyces ingoldianus]KAF2466453.1 hypothetical protein BDR25DRAFT_237663 [Lindgomyces ingoldianus]
MGDCSDFPEGAAPLPDEDTWEKFDAMDEYSSFAHNAVTPSGYVKIFEDFNSTVVSMNYIGVWTLYAYEPQLCADSCTEQPGCKAFNIYVSRDPSKDPGPNCPNPPSVSNFRCALYSSEISVADATNDGQVQPPADANGDMFIIKHKGSNGMMLLILL